MLWIVDHHVGNMDGWTPKDVTEVADATDRYHRETKKWSAIGYTIVIFGGVAALVGDLNTARANVLGLNDKVIGVLMGIDGDKVVPTAADLAVRSAVIGYLRGLCPNAVVVAGHRELPGQATSCPGARYHEWRALA